MTPLRSTGRRGSVLRSLWLDHDGRAVLVAEVEAREGVASRRVVRWVGGGAVERVAVGTDEEADAWVRARCGVDA